MTTEDFKELFICRIEAGFKIIQIVSYEYRRVLGFCLKASEKTKRTLYWWNKANKIQTWDPQNKDFRPKAGEDNPESALKWFKEQMEKKSIMVMENLHLFYPMQLNILVDHIKNVSRIPDDLEKTLILLEPTPELPKELIKDVTIMELPLPDSKLLITVLEESADKINLDIEKLNKEDKELIAKAALGLTYMEAELTFKEIGIKYKKLTKKEIPYIIEMKEQIIKKSGILEYIHPKTTIDDVGGMDNIKKWLKKYQKAFNDEAKEFGIDPPKGILLLGVPGCGKSLVAKTIGAMWNYPLIKFDLGRVFGGVIGQSESNIRKALEIADAVAPCVLWIDEIEKGVAGSKSSGELDSGVTLRVIGTLLNWMQDREKPVFVVATANNIKTMPPEMLRKGRFSAIFFVDIPDKRSRIEIFKIHLRKKMKSMYDEKIFDFEKFAENSVYFTGAEIEEAINSALMDAYNDDEVINNDYLIKSLKQIKPDVFNMTDYLTNLRIFAKNNFELATSEEVEEFTDEIKKTEKVGLNKLISEPLFD